MELAPLAERLGAGAAIEGVWGPYRRARLAGLEVVLAASGVGKASAAGTVAAFALELRPRAVVQVGIGGAYLGSFLSNGMVAAASSELQLDLGLRRPDGSVADLAELGFAASPARSGRPARYSSVPTHAGLQQVLSDVLGLPLLRFATLDAITAGVDVGAALQRAYDVSIESMEGAAAAQAADRLGLPFAEVRGVSNLVGERDKALWDVRGAVRASCAAAFALLRAWDEHPITQVLEGSAVPGSAC